MKLFPLVKEIASRSGVLHFRRWRILELPWFRIYLHYIAQSDQDKDPHSHPWHFVSLLLKGKYFERNYRELKHHLYGYLCRPASLVFHKRSDAHHISIVQPVWSLVFCFGKHREWGYQTENGFVQHEQYRLEKNKQLHEAPSYE